MRVEAAIAAGGIGKRFGTDQPKQFCLLRGIPILSWTIDRFEKCPLVDGIIVVVPRGMKQYTRDYVILPYGYQKVRVLVEGGKERRDSVMQALKVLQTDVEIVLVHDGVRPMVSQELIERVIRATEKWQAVVPGLPIGDTVKQVSQYSIVEHTLERKRLSLVQTPQGFKKDLICKAYEEAQKKGEVPSDDASLVERLGTKVKMIPGEEVNIKITSPQDLVMSDLFLV